MVVRLQQGWSRGRLPEWCRVLYETDAPVEFGTAPTDAVHEGERWVDVSRSPGAHTELPEIVLELDDVVVSSKGAVWKGSELVHGRAWGLVNDELDSVDPAGEAPYDVDLQGTYASIVLHPQAFGHWLLHRLPRLHSLSRTVSPPRVLSVELPYNDQPFFDSYGIDEVHRLGRFPTTRARVEHLVLTTHVARPSGDRWIDSRRLAALIDDLDVRWATELTQPDLPADIYITRRDRLAEREGCVNRDALERYFADQGYTIVYPPDLSVPAQFALFRGARSVVGEKGSGMHWALACDPGTSVTYITSRAGERGNPFDTNSKNWMSAIAEARGLHFGQIVASPEPSPQRWSADLDRVSSAWSSRPEGLAPHSPR